jgi:hypothetical protein
VGLNETIGEPLPALFDDESGDDFSGAKAIEIDLFAVKLCAVRPEGGQEESNTGRILGRVRIRVVRGLGPTGSTITE